MALSYDLISQFAKLTGSSKRGSSEATVYGTVVADANGNKYVKLDGSDQLTPLSDDERPTADSTSVDANVGERVSVLIKNHTATVTGNISSPAARTGDVKDLGDQVTEIQEFDILIGKRVEANEAYIKNLQVDKASVGELNAATAKIQELEAKKASVEELNAAKAEITDLIADKIDAEVADLKFATIKNLDATNAEVNKLQAKDAEIEKLVADELNAVDAEFKNLDAKYANIDFANIGEAAVKKLFADFGLIENIVVSEGTITGALVGVTIKGDIIEGGTIIADKLVVKGEDGLYYKLNTDGVTTEAEQTEYNSLDGSIITAKSITATKISVDDLVAFDATIGGFNITDHSLYSGVKESVDNSTRGIYLDKEGQLSIGDSDNFLRYFKTVDADGNEVYKLEISAESILFGANSKSSAADLKALTEHVKIGTYLDPDTNDEKPCVELAEGDSDFKQVITNTKTIFMDGSEVKTEINTDGIESENVTVRREIRHGNWVRVLRSNGNYGLIWKEDD